METFLKHLCDVAATPEQKHQHPLRSDPKPSQEVLFLFPFCSQCPLYLRISGPIPASCWTTMAERTSSGLLTMMLEPTPAVAMTLPAEVREKLAELELELSEGKLTAACTPPNQNNLRQKRALSSSWRGNLNIKLFDSCQNHRPLFWLCGSCLKTCQETLCNYQTSSQVNFCCS